MHPFKNFWERVLRDGDSDGGMGSEGQGDPGTDPMGGEQGVGAGSSNASGSGSNAEGAGNDPGTGAGVGAEGSESPSAAAPENVGVNAAESVGTAPSAAPGTTATSNVGTTTDAPTSQEENATVSTSVSNAPQGFANVAGVPGISDAMTEEEAMTAVTPGVTPSMSTSVAANVSPNQMSLSQANNNVSTPTGPNSQTSTTPGPSVGNMSLGGYTTTGVNPDMGSAPSAASQDQSSGAAPTGEVGASTAAAQEAAPAAAPTGEPSATPSTDQSMAPGAATGGPTGSPSGSESGETAGPQTQATPQSFSQIAGATTSGVTSIADILSSIAGAVNPIGSAQAQVVDPNTGGIGGGQGQQGMTEEEEKAKANKGKSFGGVAPTGTADVSLGLANAVRGLMGAPQVTPQTPPAPPVPMVPYAGPTTPTAPPLPTPTQINAPAILNMGEEEAGIPAGTKGAKGFAGVAAPTPPAPAMPPRGPAIGPIGPPTAPSVPKGFPGGIGVSPERAEEMKGQVEAAVAPKTIEQIMNQPPAPVYSRMPALRGPGLIDAIGKNAMGKASQSGDGTGGPSTPGAQGQAPGVKGQTTTEEEQSVVPALPKSFGNVAPAPAVPSVVPALPPSITTTQQPTEETMPAATIDPAAPKSFTQALAAANETMTVEEGMQAIGKLREQAAAVLSNPNATEEEQAAAKSYMEKTNGIANPGAMNVAGTAPSVQANQQKQGTAAAIRGNPSIGLIDRAFVGAQVNPVTLSTATNIAASVAKVGSVSGIPGVSTVASLGSRAAGKYGGSTQGATLGQEEATPGTPGSTAPYGGDDEGGGFGAIGGVSSGARLADMGLAGVNSFATIGSGPLVVQQDYGLTGDAFSAFGYSLPGEVDDPKIPEAGRRVTNGFLLRRVA